MFFDFCLLLLLSCSDHGNQADGNVNEETISNQSGDTPLLTDEEDINTYANILRRQRRKKAPVHGAPGSQAGSFLGRGHVLTDFERANFGTDNSTPGRTCTAYFSVDYFVDSKAVFDELEELGIPHESVVCLQRRPSREVLIAFVDEETKNKFVSCIAIRWRDSSLLIDDEDIPLTYLNV